MSDLEARRSPTRQERHRAVRAHIAAQLPKGVELPDEVRATILTIEQADPGVDHVIYNCKTVLPVGPNKNEFDMEWPVEAPVVEPVTVFQRAPEPQKASVVQPSFGLGGLSTAG
jgi:hypothetical protein